MKKTILIVLLFILSLQTVLAQDYSYKPNYSVVLDSTQGPKALDQCSRWAPKKVKEFWNPSQPDIGSLEKNFRKVLDLKASKGAIIGGVVRNFEEYGFQYTGIVIKKKKYIYVNAFRVRSEEELNKRYNPWKTEVIGACDGGDNFWGVVYDIEYGTFEQLAFNGIG